MHPGQGPGLSLHDLGETGGNDTVSLLESQMPAHTHAMRASPDDGELKAPTPNRSLARSIGGFCYQSSTAGLQAMAGQALPPAGGGTPHNNLMPYLTFYFCIALQGVFPPRG